MTHYDRDYAAAYDYDELWSRRRRMRPARLGPFGWEPFGYTGEARRQGYGEVEGPFDYAYEFRPRGRPRSARYRGEDRRGAPVRPARREWRDYALEYDDSWREWVSVDHEHRRGRRYARGAGRRWGRRAGPTRPDFGLGEASSGEVTMPWPRSRRR